MTEKMRELILEILAEVDDRIEEGVDLIEEGVINSFVIVNIVMELEEAFDIEIDAENVTAENFQSVESILALVENELLGNCETSSQS